MKAQFKYAFMTGFYIRGIVFAAIFVMMAVFIILGSLDWLPVAAQITAVSLGGVAIAVMFAANIYSDVTVLRRMFVVPEAYLYMLTPAPRWKILLASIITVLAADLITMAIVITGEVWLSFILSGIDWNIIFSENDLLYVIWGILQILAFYLLLLVIILFAITAKKSIFFKMPASGLLAFLLACACFYIVSLSPLILFPFSTIQRYGLLITVNVKSVAGLFVFVLITLLEAVALFIVTAKLMERRMNV